MTKNRAAQQGREALGRSHGALTKIHLAADRRCRPVHSREGLIETMTHIVLQQIPLASAYLCQDCNVVGNCAMRCSACSSRVLLGLAGVLDRQQRVADIGWSR